MKRMSTRVLLGFALQIIATSTAHAIVPGYISDQRLANSPIIVVAKWEKAPFKQHHKQSGNVITAIESFTRLNVIRVIKGNVKPGAQPMMVGFGIDWAKDGDQVTSGTSTELLGDVFDVTQPCLWFLWRDTSWDTKDKTQYLSITNYRSIQPLALEKYFAAIATKNPEAAIGALLASKDSVVVSRALQYVCGEVLPWPNDSEFERRYFAPAEQGEILRGQAAAVLSLIERKELEDLRPLAVSVYAHLEGKKSIEYVRTLLEDRNAEVRLTALGLLARNQDKESAAAFAEAAKGDVDASLTCTVIEALRNWGDLATVPALIQFLENDDSAGFAGDDLFIPAIKTRKALLQITGCAFPPDVEASAAAWSKSQQVQNPEDRRKLLASLIPSDAAPLNAEVIGDNDHAFLRLTNRSKQAVTISRIPSYGLLGCAGGSSGCGFGEENGDPDDEFTTLTPGQSLRLRFTLEKYFLLADPATRSMSVVFDQRGKNFGVKAWIGAVDVKFGPEWQEIRKEATVEETWPNGNLKSTGKTINGERFGEWNFFNEAGDRIAIEHYASGRGSAGCAPEHPDNNGAGKRTGKSK